MTPEKRLDQLEPLIAEIAQKQDRMLGQLGLIVDKASKVDIIESNTEIVAKGVAQLTTTISQMSRDLSGLKDGQARLEANLANIQSTQQTILTLLQERLR